MTTDGHSACGLGGMVGEIIGYFLVGSVPYIQTAERANQPFVLIGFLFYIDAHNTHGWLHLLFLRCVAQMAERVETVGSA